MITFEFKKRVACFYNEKDLGVQNNNTRLRVVIIS
jgi:hypothetical protein